MSSNAELKDAFRQVLNKFPARQPFVITVSSPLAKGVLRRVFLTSGRKCNPPPFKINANNFDKNLFVHSCHTCDGCSKSPIIGTRYHATKMPNFDLYETCFQKYEGDKNDFEPVIHNCDRPMQKRWIKRQFLNSSTIPSVASAVSHQTVIFLSSSSRLRTRRVRLLNLQQSTPALQATTVRKISPREPKRRLRVPSPRPPVLDCTLAALLDRP